MNIDVSNLSSYALAAITVGAVFLAALWLSLIFWVLRDIRSRTRDPLMIILSLLLAVILFLPGVLLYLIIRPPKTFEQKYREALEEEAILQEMERQLKCPGCGKPIESGWMLCPLCHTKLKKKCVSCGELLELQWNLCPHCGEPQQKPYAPENAAGATGKK